MVVVEGTHHLHSIKLKRVGKVEMVNVVQESYDYEIILRNGNQIKKPKNVKYCSRPQVYLLMVTSIIVLLSLNIC